MKYQSYRCSHCQTRHRFFLSVWNKRPGPCRKCGGWKFRIEKLETCLCDAYWFVHRLGGGACSKGDVCL